MCIIAYKRKGIPMPSMTRLKHCFINNPDGAGYMFAAEGKVHIIKGLMTFEAFKRSLKKTIEAYGENRAYVMHFRISTQAGVRRDNTHPFPIVAKIDKMRSLRAKSRFGVVHNGIIWLTSTFKDKQLTHNDTMEFIAEYLTLIIKNEDYYKDKDAIILIEKLTESKLVIMDSRGHCEVLGQDWVEDDGILYSNDTFSPPPPRTYLPSYSFSGYEYGYDEVTEAYYNEKTGLYDFEPFDCPGMDDQDFCSSCSSRLICLMPD